MVHILVDERRSSFMHIRSYIDIECRILEPGGRRTRPEFCVQTRSSPCITAGPSSPLPSFATLTSGSLPPLSFERREDLETGISGVSQSRTTAVVVAVVALDIVITRQTSVTRIYVSATYQTSLSSSNVDLAVFCLLSSLLLRIWSTGLL